jgi:DNA replication licensing factor MCM3
LLLLTFLLESDHAVALLSIIIFFFFRDPREQDGEVLPMGSSVEMLSTQNPDLVQGENVNTPIYEKYDPLLHGGTRTRKYVRTSRLILKLLDQLDVYLTN